MDFFFFSLRQLQPIFFSSLFSVPACLASPSRCVCMSCFPPHSLFVPFLFFQKKTRRNFAFSPCFSITGAYVRFIHIFFVLLAPWSHFRADPSTSTAFSFFSCSQPADDVVVTVVANNERIFYIHLNEFICCSFLFALFCSNFVAFYSVNTVHVLKLPPSASSCPGGTTFNLERWKWKNSNRRWFMSLVFLSFQRFDTNEEMVAHQAKHLTESKYKCELCGKHFPSQSSVWKHTKAHSGERPFVW